MKTRDKWIYSFQQRVLPIIIKEVKPDKVLLFGSRVLGCATEESDIDALVISPFFSQMPFLKRMPYLLQKTRFFEKHIDYMCFSPEEFQRNIHSSSILQDAMRHAISAM